MTAQFTSCLQREPSPTSGLGMEEIQRKVAISQSELVLVNTAAKTRQKVHECKHCGQLFDQLSAYKEHERIHIGMKPYGCKHCDKCFRYLSRYKEHERSHTGQKPYTCKFCKKCFNQPSHCKQHERTHTGEKPYTCKHCKKCFSQPSACKTHERIHTGAKPYTCKHCDKCFSRLSHCKVHEKKHAIESPLNPKQNDQNLKLRSNVQQPSILQGGKKPRMLFSSTGESSSQVESLTCWICQEEFTSETFINQHYDDHMR